jgi:hypothetical protein
MNWVHSNPYNKNNRKGTPEIQPRRNDNIRRFPDPAFRGRKRSGWSDGSVPTPLNSYTKTVLESTPDFSDSLEFIE